MIGRVNTRVAGSLLIGMGLVAAALLISRYSSPTSDDAALRVTSAPPPERTAITVKDSNSDGVEDWQEPFLTAAPVLLDTDLTKYERDNTVTEQVSITLMENILTSQSMGGAGIPNADIVRQSTNQALSSMRDKTYTQAHISVIQESGSELVREYGNTIANIFSSNDVKGGRNELMVLEEAMRTKDQKFYAEIEAKAEMYAKNRDMMLALPVPIVFSKEHLALINIFNILSNDLSAMVEIETDPLKSLLRLRSYETNASTLAFAMQGMYFALAKYPTAFKAEDPAIAFSMFAEVMNR